MQKTTLIVAMLSFALVAPFTAAHPPSLDPHNGCLVKGGDPSALPSPTVPVVGTVSYFAGLGTSLKECFQAESLSEWGSHAGACTPDPTGLNLVTATFGALCGPFVPPKSTATCSWTPVVNTVPTGLVIGFDATGNGLAAAFPDGELFVYGPFPPFAPAWTVANPYGVAAQVIAFPTDLAGPGAAPGDVNLITCVTP